VQLKIADEKFGKAKEAATTQIKKLRADVKKDRSRRLGRDQRSSSSCATIWLIRRSNCR
jgi:hypothetical protein